MLLSQVRPSSWLQSEHLEMPGYGISCEVALVQIFGGRDVFRDTERRSHRHQHRQDIPILGCSVAGFVQLLVRSASGYPG